MTWQSSDVILVFTILCSWIVVAENDDDRRRVGGTCVKRDEDIVYAVNNA